jgi:hypothetical protein
MHTLILRTCFLRLACLSGLLMVSFVPACPVFSQTTPPDQAHSPGPMLTNGTRALAARELTLSLVRSSGTAARLSPTLDPSLDYTPGDLLAERSTDTFYHLGDLDLRFRAGNDSAWQDASTAFRRQPVLTVTSTPGELSQDLAPTLPADLPLQIIRTWSAQPGHRSADGPSAHPDEIALSFTLTNRSARPVHLGGVGIPMVFNNIMNGRTLEQSYAKCSFYDPSISEDAGYVQVARLTGTGPVLLIAPLGRTPLEAWKPILDQRVKPAAPPSNADKPAGKSNPPQALLLNDPTPRGITFEGSFDWMVHSLGFAETSWQGVQEWNPSTETVLAPGASVTYGLRFFLAPSLRAIESTLAAHQRPVAIGIPGYILPQDQTGRLFLRYPAPVASITSEPANALSIHDDGPAPDTAWHAYTLHGLTWGRARLRIAYADGTVQSIAYRTIKPEAQAIGDMGHFLFHQQWFADPVDPFHRSPSVISYDNQTGKQVTQEPRVWIAGLSDEAGAGSWLAAAMKERIDPSPHEVRQLEQFVNQTLWGHLQVAEGPHKWGVHKSLFFYDPAHMPAGTYDPSTNWTTWASWNPEAAADLGRSFNYAHVVAAYWSLYRIARNTTGLTTMRTWQWYLHQATDTVLAMQAQAPYYLQFGQMEGTVYLRLLDDLEAEGWTTQAAQIETMMQAREARWRTEAFPFGSEMPWDSTGQEEVYDWTRYFGDDAKAELTLNAILAYTPVVPSWGYNGSARRYWDFLYGGKFERIERQLHHYGSGLNAIPLLAEYRRRPDDLYLLRAGYGGVMGPLANIDEKGFASAAFHSFPDKMAYDPYSGDYGPNFLGHSLNTATFLVHDTRFGWLAFGGNITQHGNRITVQVLDSARQQVFIAPLGLWLTLQAGQFSSVTFDPSVGNAAPTAVTVELAPQTACVHTARLQVERVDSRGSTLLTNAVQPRPAYLREAYSIPLHGQKTKIRITP